MTTSLGGAPCKACSHPARAALELDLVRGMSSAAAARKFGGLTADGVRRHKAKHLHQATMAAAAAERAAGEEKRGADLLVLAQQLANKAISLLQSAERTGDLRGALSGIGQAINALSLVSKLTGAVSTAPTVNIAIQADTQATAIRILAALGPYPAAKEAVLKALTGGGMTIEGGAAQPALEAADGSAG